MSDQTVAGFRLSNQQERTWSQLAGRVTPFWAECELAIAGSLNVEDIRSAVREIVERHEILRTAFHRQAGVKVPFQVVLDAPAFAWSTADLAGMNESDQRERLAALVGNRRTVVDLEHGPVLHVVMAKVLPNEYRLTFSLPAMCADLISLDLFAGELTQRLSGLFSDADDVMQYADIAAWQQDLLASDESKPARDYWRDYGRKIDFSSLATMLSSFERKPAGDFSPNTVAVDIDASSVFEVASLPESFLAAWAAFLSRMTGRANVTVGCQLDGRTYAEFSNAIGPFARDLPLTATCSAEVSFAGLLANVQHDVVDFRNWQDSIVWNGVGFPAGEDHALPLAFEFSDMPEPVRLGQLTVSTIYRSVCSERFALKLLVQRHGNQLGLSLVFDEGHIDRETVKRWSGYFATFLRALAADSAAPISRLPLLDDAEREALVVNWNQTSVEYPRDRCIHQLFEDQVGRTPDASAVRYEDDCLSYRELNDRANQLAHHLRTKGVCAGALVGLCLERSTSMIVAVLATLKAGGAYVPLSADHPRARLEQQLSGATVVITEGKFECLMPAFAGSTVLLDRDRQQWLKLPLNNPHPVSGPEDFAYVIYTSGSTGNPKGVAVRHRNLVNYSTFITRRLGLEADAQHLNFATVSTLGADLGNTCIYPSLISGGCLHVIATDSAADSNRLREYMTKYPVDVLKIVPSHLMALLNAGGGKEILPRKHLVLGGEVFTRALLEKIVAAGGTCEVMNHYGPTETTVGSLTLRLSGYDYSPSSAQNIPIGRPIDNTRIYILDSHGQLVPPEVAGELYIAGDGVAGGYIDRPELTAERFVPECFSLDPNAKMYRTGDVVRYLPDGNVEFLGRADDQVKIRGFRIELGELEALLLRHAGVQQASVLAPANDRGEKSLAAYVVGEARVDELRTYLRGQVPEYMLPSNIILLPKFPLNANGKIDRQALPKPEDVKGSKESIAPRTPSEDVVSAIWTEVLKRGDIGVEDNFFEIGGHSLLATQIASRLREHFKIAVPVRAVFESPSIAELARRMDTARREEQGTLPPSITAVPRNGTIPLSHAQERLWVLDQIEPESPLYNIPRTFRLRGSLRVESLERAINEIVRRHESQRTVFDVYGNEPVQVILSSLTVPLDLHDLTSLPDDEREPEARRLAIAEGRRPFNLERAPLVRACLFRLAPDDHVLQLTMHHIISDAWSAGIFLQEMTTLYEAYSSGMASPLPELKAQYADYAAQERAWLQGDVLNKQLSFWHERLKGLPPVIDLPLDRPRPPVRTFAGSCESFRVESEKLSKVKDFARQESATLFMMLMAVFQAMLSKYSGEEQIVVGTDLANRTMPETEAMIGFFINLLAVRTDLSGNPTFRELLGRVREGLLESYAHQEVPFPKIVQEVQAERSAVHNPIVQVLFVMENTPQAKREMAGLQVEPFEVPVTSSKFDLAMFVTERPEGLAAYLVYSTELFERATIRRMVGHFTKLLESAVSQPDTRLSTLPMLSEEEIAQQEAARTKRKQSQFSKLRATAPSSVGFSGDDKTQQ